MKLKLLYILTAITLTSCIKLGPGFQNKKDEPHPPSGLNHFYFYTELNGQDVLYVAKKSFGLGLGDNMPAIEFDQQSGANYQGQALYGNNHNIFRFELFFNGGITHTGTYLLKATDSPEYDIHVTNLNQHQAFLFLANRGIFLSKDNCGSIDITYLSPDKKEFKGKFNMTLYAYNRQDSIKIKNGHFWINIDSLYHQ